MYKKPEKRLKPYRSEIKYILTKHDVILLQNKLCTILDKDKNMVNGNYKVRSLYFDDYKNTSYYQVLDGISERWKWRIRYYNDDISYICLEKKYKINGLINKKSVVITKKQALDIINLTNIKVEKSNSDLLNEFYLSILQRNLRPKIIVDYNRIPYVYSSFNIRITIDFNLAASYQINEIFNKDLCMVPVMEKNKYILEVKYDNYIPDYIKNKIGINYLERTSYSKYLQSILVLDKLI